MPTPDEQARINQVMDKIQGWASHGEGYFLYEAAKSCSGKGVIVEIGSWKGKSTVALGLGSKQGKKVTVYAIDPHTGSPDHLAHGQVIWTFDEFKKNIVEAGVSEVIEPVLRTADDAAVDWQAPIELLYIDVNYHSYELSKHDFLIWTKKLIDGGTVVIHNTYPALRAIIAERQPLTGWPGPRKMLNELLFGSTTYKNIGLVDNSVFATKCVDNNISDRLKGRLVQLRGLTLLLLYRIYCFFSALLPPSLKRQVKKMIR